MSNLWAEGKNTYQVYCFLFFFLLGGVGKSWFNRTNPFPENSFLSRRNRSLILKRIPGTSPVRLVLTFLALKYVFESVEDGVIPSFRKANTTFTAASGLCARPHLPRDCRGEKSECEQMLGEPSEKADDAKTSAVPWYISLTRTKVRCTPRRGLS